MFLLWLLRSVHLEVMSEPPLISSTSSPPRAHTLCGMKVRELKPAPQWLLPTFLCTVLLLFSKWWVRARQSVSLPSEHTLKIENKMHCDILAKRPFSGFGKKPAEQALIVTQPEENYTAQMSPRSLFAVMFSVYIWLFFLFILKDRGSKPLQLCFLLIKVSPTSHKSHPCVSKTQSFFSVSNW